MSAPQTDLSLIDYFAARVMQAMLTHHGRPWRDDRDSMTSPEQRALAALKLARQCYMIAEAMCVARDEQEGGAL